MNMFDVKAQEDIRLNSLSQNIKVRRKKSVEEIYKTLKPKAKEYREPTDIPGLYCRVKPNGKKHWQYRYKNNQAKWTWIGLGSYPSVSYAQAREKAEAMTLGEIPIQTKVEIKKNQLEQEEALYSHLIYEWLERKKQTWAPETFKKEKQSIERHLIPVFGYRQYKSITPAEWLEFFTEKQTNEGIYNRIEKLISYCSGAYGLAKFKKGILYNPLEGIRDHLAKGESKSMKHVKIHQLPELISLIRNTSSQPVAIGLELLIHMFPRLGELRQAKWEQFDFVEKVDDVIPVQYNGMKKELFQERV